MSNYKLEVTEENVVELYNLDNPNENGAPFLRQDLHPSGRAWTSREDAMAWGQAWIDGTLVPPFPAESEEVI